MTVEEWTWSTTSFQQSKWQNPSGWTDWLKCDGLESTKPAFPLKGKSWHQKILSQKQTRSHTSYSWLIYQPLNAEDAFLSICSFVLITGWNCISWLLIGDILPSFLSVQIALLILYFFPLPLLITSNIDVSNSVCSLPNLLLQPIMAAVQCLRGAGDGYVFLSFLYLHLLFAMVSNSTINLSYSY